MLGEVKTTQDSDAEAVQAHQGVVVTLSVPAPPASAMLAAEGVTEYAQAGAARTLTNTGTTNAAKRLLSTGFTEIVPVYSPIGIVSERIRLTDRGAVPLVTLSVAPGIPFTEAVNAAATPVPEMLIGVTGGGGPFS